MMRSSRWFEYEILPIETMSTTVDFDLSIDNMQMVLQHKLQINSPDVNAFELYLHHWPLNYRRLYNI